ncbi:YchJ family protein [Jatrophihabitans endophyticus]|uniref:YchJ family protein n=1 Tax=Jatrophihabitans endophyticus TaxID=1206085 RepID=UPI000933039F|nr:YchJ family metal-binding protein [Jatrophihabitans endophyticus]
MSGTRGGDVCLCGSGGSYAVCCRPAHAGERPAATAEALMRSRYSAFARGDTAYLLRTWDASTRPRELSLPAGVRWTRLRVLAVEAGGPGDATGTVEFRAHFRQDGEPDALHERSTFRRDAHGHWMYVAATAPEA